MRLHVATRGMNAFIDVLEKDTNFTDLITLTLDILDCTLTDATEEEQLSVAADDEIGDRLAELLLQKVNFMPALIKLLTTNEFTIRRFKIFI